MSSLNCSGIKILRIMTPKSPSSFSCLAYISTSAFRKCLITQVQRADVPKVTAAAFKVSRKNVSTYFKS